MSTTTSQRRERTTEDELVTTVLYPYREWDWFGWLKQSGR